MAIRGFRELLASRVAAAALSPLSSNVIQQLEIYYDVLQKWNRSINLTALPLDPLSDRALDRLFVEPLCAAHVLSIWHETQVQQQDSEWIDVGSGGGSPAIPLRLMRPHGTLLMVESRARKAAFLRELVRELQLDRTTVEAVRFESLTAELIPRQASLITTRAVRIDQEIGAAICRLLRSSGSLVVLTSETAQLPEPEGLQLCRKASLGLFPHSQAFLFQHSR